MNGFVTPAAARETLSCPLARTFDEKVGPNCDADRCAVWRWRPLLVSDPGYKEALVKAKDMKTERGTLTPAEYVKANRSTFGLPEDPFCGYCGLGGEPKT